MDTLGIRDILSEGQEFASILDALLANLEKLDLTNDVEVGPIKALGGYADVHEGWLSVMGRDSKEKVAVKRFRRLVQGNTDFIQVRTTAWIFNRRSF